METEYDFKFWNGVQARMQSDLARVDNLFRLFKISSASRGTDKSIASRNPRVVQVTGPADN